MWVQTSAATRFNTDQWASYFTKQINQTWELHCNANGVEVTLAKHLSQVQADAKIKQIDDGLKAGTVFINIS